MTGPPAETRKEWIVEAVPGGWRVVNRLNREEAVRSPEQGFAVTIFATEAEATTMRDVLARAGA